MFRGRLSNTLVTEGGCLPTPPAQEAADSISLAIFTHAPLGERRPVRRTCFLSSSEAAEGPPLPRWPWRLPAPALCRCPQLPPPPPAEGGPWRRTSFELPLPLHPSTAPPLFSTPSARLLKAIFNGAFADSVSSAHAPPRAAYTSEYSTASPTAHTCFAHMHDRAQLHLLCSRAGSYEIYPSHSLSSDS
jgi:hypothetical protein